MTPTPVMAESCCWLFSTPLTFSITFCVWRLLKFKNSIRPFEFSTIPWQMSLASGTSNNRKMTTPPPQAPWGGPHFVALHADGNPDLLLLVHLRYRCWDSFFLFHKLILCFCTLNRILLCFLATLKLLCGAGLPGTLDPSTSSPYMQG